nr:MAG TPA: hypothetical protein [Caudoviricetes sp.]DAU41320.1 MAG TPA: hypothetical protein [Bacteriophage sp.]
MYRNHPKGYHNIRIDTRLNLYHYLFFLVWQHLHY